MAYYPFATEKDARYTLTGPDGTIAVFNDPLDPNYVGSVSELVGLDSAEIRESAQDLTEADGGSHGNFFMSRRPIVMTVSVYGHASVAERNIRIDRARRASLALRGDATLSWEPSTRRENLLVNPTLALNTANTGTTAGMTINRLISPASSVPGWGGGAGTGFQWTGTTASTSAYMTISGAATMPGGGKVVPVSPTKQYSVRGWTRLVSVTSGTVSNLRILVWWYKADGTNSATSSTTVQQVNSPTAGSTEYDWAGLVTPPSDAAYGLPAVYVTTTNPTTFEVRGSKMMMDEATAIEAYIDGDSAGAYWQGDRSASTSGDFIEMFTTVRRQQPFRESGNWVKELQIPLVSEYAPLFSTGLRTVAGTGVSVDNRGSYPAFPIYSVAGVATNPTIALSTGGSITTTGLTVASGETVAFDSLNHTAVFTSGARNGQSANRYINFSTTVWPSIPAASSSTVSTTSGTLSTSWRDAWA